MGDVRSTARRTRPWAAGASRSLAGAVVRLAGCLVLVIGLNLWWWVPPASAAPVLEVAAAPELSLVGAAVELHVTGALGGRWPATRAAVEIRGPLTPSAGTETAPVAGRFEQDLGDVGPALDVRLPVPAEAIAAPGAYHVTVSLASGDDLRAGGAGWLGRVAADQRQVDLALVWPVMTGIHRDTEGVFVDRVVQDVVVPAAESPGSIYSLLGIAESHPGWHLTLAMEPVLLGQIRDLSNGYRERDAQGAVVDVAEDTQVPTFARQALTALTNVAQLESWLFIPTPYASPSLPMLAREGWAADGVEQMQLGKIELVSSLQLAAPPDGAYPPGQDITTDSVASLSDAAVDYALVGPEVARDLVLPEGGTPAGLVRVMDRDNNRLTFMIANAELEAALTAPWRLDRLAASLAAVLASGYTGPLIGAPASDYGWPTGPYLDGLGDMLARAPYLRTRTLDEIRALHPPDTRPVFLTRYGGRVEGFVGREFLEDLRQAHGLVSDLDGATDSERAPLDRLYLQLFEAQSRYWFVAGVNPIVANLALSFPRAITDTVHAEFDQIDVVADTSVIIVGDEGDVPVAVVNQTGYPMTVELSLEGSGVEFLEGGTQTVTLGPQENVFSVPVRTSRGSTGMRVKVSAGETIIDQESIALRSISVRTVVPWVLGAVAVVVLTFVLVRRLR